ncbi:DNA-directed RNA polymerase I subunit RPA34.5-domain-containing protein [Xylariaceae sp. FL0016]|nr:DNA-directed RNA polymerase I subunit RPA34.5-domain-containing protein [Xylariaceae sp. FL0016]
MLNGSDFTLRKASTENPGKEVANFFSNANLEGKQLWYFTAPADLPITVLKDMEIDLAKAANGQSILNYKGDAYGIDLEADATSTQISLLIPSKNGDKYTAPNRGVESIIHLRRSAKFGPGNTVSATATDGYAPIPKPIRQQPEGLKARFTPLGVPTPAPTISSQPSAPSSAQPRPRAIPKHMHNSSESSSSDSDESESSSDEEMGGALSLPPKASQSTGVNGNGKRKLSTHKEDLTSTPKATSKTEEKPSKRAKVTSSGDINKTKFSSSISSSQGTPSQAPKSNPKQASSSTTKSKSREKKETKGTKEKTPMKTSKTPSKQTPIPIPTNPLMKR